MNAEHPYDRAPINVDRFGQLRYPEHQYDKIVKLLEKVRDETHKYCTYQVNVYDHRPDVGLQLYLEDGWVGKIFTHEVSTLAEAVEFLEDFLRERASRGVLFKRF